MTGGGNVEAEKHGGGPRLGICHDRRAGAPDGARYSTLKFYTEEGLLPFEQAEERLTRRYPRAASVARIEAIRAWRAAGKTIPEIHSLLGM